MTKSRNLTNENVIIALSNKTKLERDCKVKSPAASLLRTDTRLTARDPFFLVVRLEVGAIRGFRCYFRLQRHPMCAGFLSSIKYPSRVVRCGYLQWKTNN